MEKEARIDTVNADYQTGDLTVLENNERVNFVVAQGATVAVEPGVLVTVIIISPQGEKKAIIVRPGGRDRA